MTDQVEACMMVSAAMPEPKEGEPGWVPHLEDWGGKLFRRIVVYESDENGNYDWAQERGEKYWFPPKLADAIDWLQGILLSVPLEYRDKTEIRVKSEDFGSYESWDKAALRVSYLRDPTPDELQRWNKKRENETVFQIQRDMKQLEQLKKKLGVA